jgi:hypothetical protein
MFTIECNAGRLLEVWVESPVALEELVPFRARLRAVLSAMPEQMIAAVDLRSARLFPPEVAEGFVSIMRGDNPRIERSAFLVSDSALFSLQIERMIREAGSPVRRAFRDPPALSAWLGQLLSPAERTRLDAFLAAH